MGNVFRRFALAAMAVSVALVAQTTVPTTAAWQDSEWVYAPVGTTDCADPQGAFATRGEGQLLSGSLLGLDLDTVAEVKGVEVTNNGTESTVDPSTATPAPSEHAYANPLDVQALNAANIGLTGFLEFPLDTEVGVVGQYAQASTTAESVGAAGTITDDGGIALDYVDGDLPDLATLDLSQLLGSTELGLDYLLDDIAQLELGIGAVAGRARLDGCQNAWGMENALQREYLTSHLDLRLESELVGSLGGDVAVSSVVTSLQNTVNIIGDGEGSVLGEVSGLLDGVVSAVGGLLSTLGLVRLDDNREQTVTLNASVNLEPLDTLLSEPFGDEGGVVAITLAEGLVEIDTVALLTATYPEIYDDGLNGLAPNTNPLADPAVLSTLTSRLGTTLSSLISQVDSALANTVNATQATIVLSIPLERCTALAVLGVCLLGSWVHAGEITVSIDETVGDLTSGQGAIEVIVPPVVVAGNPVDLNPVIGLVTGLIDGVLLASLGNTVKGALDTVATLPQAVLDGAGQPVVQLVSSLYEALFLEDVVAVTVNAQNLPDAAPQDQGPQDWLPTPVGSLPQGQYDVAAIRVGVADALGQSAVWLYLGRGSVGPACSLAGPTSNCAIY